MRAKQTNFTAFTSLRKNSRAAYLDSWSNMFTIITNAPARAKNAQQAGARKGFLT